VHQLGSHLTICWSHNGALCARRFRPAAHTEPWVNTERRLGMQPAAEREKDNASIQGERCKYYANTVRVEVGSNLCAVREVKRSSAPTTRASCVCFCLVMSMRAIARERKPARRHFVFLIRGRAENSFLFFISAARDFLRASLAHFKDAHSQESCAFSLTHTGRFRKYMYKHLELVKSADDGEKECRSEHASAAANCGANLFFLDTSYPSVKGHSDDCCECCH
jgi:hypothetical protein